MPRHLLVGSSHLPLKSLWLFLKMRLISHEINLMVNTCSAGTFLMTTKCLKSTAFSSPKTTSALFTCGPSPWLLSVCGVCCPLQSYLPQVEQWIKVVEGKVKGRSWGNQFVSGPIFERDFLSFCLSVYPSDSAEQRLLPAEKLLCNAQHCLDLDWNLQL